MASAYADEVARLLDVTPHELSARARDLFRRESGKSYPVPLVLCGAGQLGQVTFRGLRRADADVIAFADNNARLHGQEIDGRTVMVRDDLAQVVRYARKPSGGLDLTLDMTTVRA